MERFKTVACIIVFLALAIAVASIVLDGDAPELGNGCGVESAANCGDPSWGNVSPGY